MSKTNHRPSGMSATEVLVATTIFSVLLLAAFTLYQVASRAYSYVGTDGMIMQQQNARFAMDRITRTVRYAGVNVNPLGSPASTDEQLEGAWDSAIFVRGDFDASRESELEDNHFPIVMTGNDEIVGYVLRKREAAANVHTIVVKADLTSPAPPHRDQDWNEAGGLALNEETVAIHVAAVDLADQTAPPYQLIRVTFNKQGSPLMEVVADNIFRLQFRYLDTNGNEIASATHGSGDDRTQRAMRAAVRQIEVRLIGMSTRRDPSPFEERDYTPAEDAATRGHRKFDFETLVRPPNLGLSGSAVGRVPPLALAPPSSVQASATGRTLRLTWSPSTSANVTRYRVQVAAGDTHPRFYDVEGTELVLEVADEPGLERYSVASLSSRGLAGVFSRQVTIGGMAEVPPAKHSTNTTDGEP